MDAALLNTPEHKQQQPQQQKQQVWGRRGRVFGVIALSFAVGAIVLVRSPGQPESNINPNRMVTRMTTTPTQNGCCFSYAEGDDDGPTNMNIIGKSESSTTCMNRVHLLGVEVGWSANRCPDSPDDAYDMIQGHSDKYLEEDIKKELADFEKNPNPELLAKFESWKVQFDKHYESTEKENIAFYNFARRDIIIVTHNAKKLSWQLGHNMFSDLSTADSSVYLGFRNDLRKPQQQRQMGTSMAEDATPISLAEAVDWRESGMVTPVKNQGQCGSCWAIATVGVIESRVAIETGTLRSLSEQWLVSCDKGGDQGCNGGMMANAARYVAKSGGSVPNAVEYPYTSGQRGTVPACKLRHPQNTLFSVTGWTDIEVSDSSIMGALNHGPVAGAMEADKIFFQQYDEGVLNDPRCGDEPDHGILLVGYGTEAGVKFWIVKNSWGVAWGDRGYIKVGYGVCGLANSGFATLG